MSKVIASGAIRGAREFVATAERKLAEAIKAKGESQAAAFPSTAYYLPVIYSFTGIKVSTLGDMKAVLARARDLLPPEPADSVWLPYLGNALDAGVAALFACEIIEACKYVMGPNPVEGIWLGAANDIIMRERGIEFVDGSAPACGCARPRRPDRRPRGSGPWRPSLYSPAFPGPSQP
jgi:acetyl-CoA synthase